LLATFGVPLMWQHDTSFHFYVLMAFSSCVCCCIKHTRHWT
jgi:hypothetical protein